MESKGNAKLNCFQQLTLSERVRDATVDNVNIKVGPEKGEDEEKRAGGSGELHGRRWIFHSRNI